MKLYRYLFTMIGIIAVSQWSALPANEAGTSQTDAEIRKKIVGTWVAGSPRDTQNTNSISIKDILIIAPDDTFACKSVLASRGSEIASALEHEGTWEIADGILVKMDTKSQTSAFPVGKIERDQVISITHQELVYKTERGDIITRKRRKPGLLTPQEARNIGTPGLLIYEGKNKGEPLRTGNTLAGSPAANAGIRPQGFLISVEGTNVMNMPLSEALDRLSRSPQV